MLLTDAAAGEQAVGRYHVRVLVFCCTVVCFDILWVM